MLTRSSSLHRFARSVHATTAGRLAVVTTLSALAIGLVAAPAHARAKRGVKSLAMKRFNVGSREVAVIASTKSSSKGGAAIVRLQHTDVPVCQLLVLNAAPRKATAIVKTIRLRVCAAYSKEAKKARLDEVQLTNGRRAFRASVLSRRMDAIAKGVETLRFWGLFADMGTGFRAVFERTSTSFKSQVNKAVNQAEECRPPAFPVGTSPTTLTIGCTSVRMLGGAATRKTATVAYHWEAGRFVLR
jgi:hypothetical protein